MSADVGKTVLIVLLTIEALFLSDVIVGRVLPQLLVHDAGVGTIALIVLYSVPNGLFIALPTALLIGVYIVVLRRREGQEFQIFAGFGYSPRVLSITAVVIGLSGSAVSLVLSGFVEPPARYHWITTLEGVAHQAIREGELASGRFYQMGDTTFYAASGRLNEVAGDVFMHQKRSEGLGRVIVASHLSNPQTNQQGQFGLLLNNVNIYEFADQAASRSARNGQKTAADCDGCEANDLLPPLKHLQVEQFHMELPKAKLALPRDWRRPEETNFVDLFSEPDWSSGHVQVFGERLLRAALCMVTPLLALVAVALTFKSTMLMSLPAAAGVVLVLSFFASNNVALISQYGAWATAGSILGGATVLSGLCVFLVQRLNGNFIRPIGVSV
jgi:lipopolysaccharide export LptBFGC system permease protein LptF